MFSGLKNQALRIIRNYEKRYAALTEAELLGLAGGFQAELASGGITSSLLPRAFAVVREAAWRELGYRHHPEQLMAGIALSEDKLVEMKTGEGKTLAITAPAFLAALRGSGVHIVTANDYLAKRDCATMGGVYSRLGISCGAITAVAEAQYRYEPRRKTLVPCTRQEAYQVDITYGTAPAFGFDYLRDNLVQQAQDRVQRGCYFAILDEADNILLDEARTPLIISGRSNQSVEGFYRATELIKRLAPDQDYEVAALKRKAHFTESGITRLEKWLGLKESQTLYDAERSELYYLDIALQALTLYHQGEDYLVLLKPSLAGKRPSEGGDWEQLARQREKLLPPGLEASKPFLTLAQAEKQAKPGMLEGEIVLVDRERSGRPMPGRRFRGGLHEALEAKEGLVVQPSPVTYATISLHAYFRGYEKLAGLSGTLTQDRDTFHKLYRLEVLEIPSHKSSRRRDKKPLLYRTRQEALEALVSDAIRVRESGAAVLIGTTGIADSEAVSGYLAKRGIPHLVLNARQTEREALIVAQAGFPGRITVATSMAGRGTDILLGGRYEDHLADLAQKRGLVEQVDRGSSAWLKLEEDARERTKRARELVLNSGGLHVMGLGLSATKRLDLQLIGRTGRQGDPGYSRLYRSLEEELVLKFAGGWGDGLSERLGSGVEWGESITKRLAETVVEECQRKQEGQHYEELKRGIEYDRVLEVQRTTFYRDREQVLEADAGRLKMFVLKLAREEISELGTAWLEGENEVGGQEGTAGLVEATTALFGFKIASELQLFLGSRKEVSEDAIKKWLLAKLEQVMEQAGLGLRKVNLSENIRDTLLKTLDGEWVEYLTPLEELRHGIFLRVYGGQEPLREYQREAWHLWAEFQVKSQKKILENITVFCK